MWNEILDGWDSAPFVLEERDGKLYGRGSTDDKGPVIAWLNAIEAYQKNGVEIPKIIDFSDLRAYFRKLVMSVIF